MFQVCFESSSKILLDVNYFPNVTWTIDFGKISMEMSSEVPKKLSSLISTWVANGFQNTNNLIVRFKPSQTFNFDFKTLKTRFKLLDFRYSHWVSLDQLLEADTSCICLSRSNFTNSDFKTLVDKWRAGWTPKWTSLMIEFKENLDIDTCVGGEPFHTVPRNIKPLMKLVVEKESPIQLYKFDMFRRTPEGFTHKTGYHIYRSDDVVATITVEKNRIGWIEIQPFDCDVEFRFHLHMRTFQLD
ncbi:hypothetical protein GCK72_016556 [Caenorhabditis remanei]|uniref:Sdz-33 F-box domain-containing protein n=1 Tax=Caenorhabditis remanei TaxID=31234 RepID=A0A6A5G5J1_CAERE|nr:hypothetical protein GCK72_016556 [Caenorhabditis remanei]KAF1750011.1 hypothetical protein GCK72_016556 [Caenorhabditis remanei]